MVDMMGGLFLGGSAAVGVVVIILVRQLLGTVKWSLLEVVAVEMALALIAMACFVVSMAIAEGL